MLINRYSSLDHVTILLPGGGEGPGKARDSLGRAGFPFSDSSGRRGEGFVTYNTFVGRQYLEMLEISGKTSENWTDDYQRWYAGGYAGVTGITLATKGIEKVWHNLKSAGVNVGKPMRGEYGKNREKKSLPFLTLQAPVIENLPLVISWVQRDPMLENLLASGPKPNSRTGGGARAIDVVEIRGPFTDDDLAMTEKIFNGFKAGVPVELGRGKLIFIPDENYRVTLYCSGAEGDKAGLKADLDNLRIIT